MARALLSSVLALLLGALAYAAAPAAEPAAAPAAAPGLRAAMPPDVFQRSGLARLTPEELAVLEQWLRSRSTEQEQAAREAGELRVAEAVQQRLKGEIQRRQAEPGATVFDTPTEDFTASRILGPVRGLRHGRYFTLANGQVWQQAESLTSGQSFRDPEVSIVRKSFGYYLRIEGWNGLIAVRRVQ